MASDNVFGSDELSPELLRSAAFTEADGRYDAAEVRTFLDRVASSIEVFLSQDAPAALRAEFARNAQIAQQVLDAGQNASEQLRRQAAEDARRVLDETREATDRLRAQMEGEIATSRQQVEAMRAQFIQDLRDLYDRIGASLYRFERAAEESHVAPIAEPARASEPAPAPEPAAPSVTPEPEAVPETVAEATDMAPVLPEPHPAAAPPMTSAAEETPPEEVELPEGAKPPAWQQLPPEAWGSVPAGTEDAGAATAYEAPVETVTATTGGLDEFAVVEDEPLAPGEPLVDLRDMQPPAGTELESPPTVSAPEAGAEVPAAEPAPDVATMAGNSWLEAADPMGETAAPVEVPVEAEPVVELSVPAEETDGSWLDAPADIAGSPETGLAHDDALAEALIAGTPFGEEQGDGAAAAPGAAAPPPEQSEPLAGASPDAVAVRQLVLDSLAAGQSREAIETYLRDHMGFMEPGAIVDAALSAAGDA